jgi:hypothetical protein
VIDTVIVNDRSDVIAAISVTSVRTTVIISIVIVIDGGNVIDTIIKVGGSVGVAICVISVIRRVIMSIIILIDGGDVLFF